MGEGVPYPPRQCMNTPVKISSTLMMVATWRIFLLQDTQCHQYCNISLLILQDMVWTVDTLER
jgi:hypothetical protein